MLEQAAPYLPHQAPMVMIDSLVEASENHAVAKVVVTPELIFTDKNGLPTWASIELMAQTVSLYAGVQGKKDQQPPKIGFLLGSRKMNFDFAYFPLNSEIMIKAKKNYMQDNLGVFDCEITAMGKSITATLSVYEPENAKQEFQHVTK